MQGLSGASRYRVVDEIAAGGMGIVYLALRTDIDGRAEPVAIKRLHEHLVDDQAMIDSFVDEARIASRLDHPNLVRVHEVTPIDGLLVIVMDWIEGVALGGIVKRREEKLPIPIIRRVLIDALDGLHAAHELRDERGTPLGVVHRDISPQNMLVGTDGRTRVTDFGIALARGRLAPTTVHGGVKGKLPYLSPEQVNCTKLDRRCDLFAFGAVAWELLTGRRLFQAGTEGETLAKILREQIPPPSSERLDVPLDLDESVLRALERNPERRFQTADELARALEEGGPVATHEQVGRLVIAAAGTTLAARRQKLALAAERPAEPRYLREELTATILAVGPPPGVVDRGALSAGAVVSMSVPPPALVAMQEPTVRSSSTPMLVGVVVALLLAIGLVVKYKQPSEGTTPFPSAPPVPSAEPRPVAEPTMASAPLPGLVASAPSPSMAASTIELPASPNPKPHRPTISHGRARADAGARPPFMPDDL